MFQQHQRSNQDDSVDLLDGILYLNRALTYEAFPSLRAVQFKQDNEKFHISFFCDGKISEDDHESAQCIATQMISNYENSLLEVTINRLDYPMPIPKVGIVAYHRYEAGIDLREEQEKLKRILIKNKQILPPINILIAVIVGSFGNIFSALRSLQVKIHKKKIYLECYTEGNISEMDVKLLESIAGFAASCLQDYSVQYENFRCDSPNKVSVENNIITYLRKECS